MAKKQTELKVKIKAFKQSKIKDWKKFKDMIASYFGHLKWANSFKLQHKLLAEVTST